MKQHKQQFTIKAMSRVLQISRSGYYAWLKRRQAGPGPRQRRREYLDQQVKTAFKAGKGRNGAPRIHRDLCEQGDHCNLKTVARSLSRQELRAKAAKKFKVTTDSKHDLPVAPNHSGRDFSASGPNQK